MIRAELDLIRGAINQAKSIAAMRRSEAAKDQWVTIYSALDESPPGLLGKVTERGAPHILRLSMIFALMDGCMEIDTCHQNAALAVWDYSFESAAKIFGQQTGNTLADQIYDYASREHPSTCTLTGFHKITGNNKPAAEIADAVNLLLRCGRLKEVEAEPGSRGRPAKKYRVAR
jgi:hypothetical protein